VRVCVAVSCVLMLCAPAVWRGVDRQGAGGDRVFPLNYAPMMNMPDPANIGVASAVKARIYSEGLSGDSWGLSAFNLGGGPAGYDEYTVPVEVRACQH
jgi:hypothetical protein